jgi:hypothetical protein
MRNTGSNGLQIPPDEIGYPKGLHGNFITGNTHHSKTDLQVPRGPTRLGGGGKDQRAIPGTSYQTENSLAWRCRK